MAGFGLSSQWKRIWQGYKKEAREYLASLDSLSVGLLRPASAVLVQVAGGDLLRLLDIRHGHHDGLGFGRGLETGLVVHRGANRGGGDQEGDHESIHFRAFRVCECVSFRLLQCTASWPECQAPKYYLSRYG
jgi:hypothetical protein